MNTPIACLTLCCAAVALRAQTSADYLVHHEFLPPSGAAYTNSGSTGAVNDGTPSGSVTLAVSPLGVGVTLGGAAGDEILCGPSPVNGSQARTVSVWARTTAASGIVTPLTLGTNGFGSKWDMDIDASNGGVLELGVGAGRTTGQGPALNDGQWHTLIIPLTDFSSQGVDLTMVSIPLRFGGNGGMEGESVLMDDLYFAP